MIDSSIIKIDSFTDTVNDNLLSLSPIQVNEDYKKKWNEHCSDFVCLTRNGKLISESLYRIGGMGTPKLNKDNYFMLLKYSEAFYEDNITKDKDKKRHLQGCWCILDKNGIEKVQAKLFKYLHIVKDSCIYSTDGKYYNIETEEFYCNTNSSMESSNYLFLENKWDKDESKRGVMKINKKDGSYELFK